MTITYLTIENISSGLFRNQVINKLQAIVDSSTDISFEIVVFNSPQHFFKHRRLLADYRAGLSDRIKIRYYSVLPPLRYVLSSITQSKLLLGWLTLVLKFIKIKGEVIHCRSYWPAIIALRVSDIPILFDVRSLYPAESVAAGKLALDSKEYEYWLNLEEFCFRKAKVISVVSEPMIKYVKKICPSGNIHYNPIIVNTKQIYFDVLKRTEFRKKLNWEENIILVYSGSLGYSGLNRQSLGTLLKTLSGLGDNFRFLFLTNENNESTRDFVETAGIKSSHIYVTESSVEDLHKWLSAADIGLHALPLQLDSDTRLGTKVVEYWANGLPVILNENVGAAVDIILKHNIGMIVSESEENDKEHLLTELDKLLEMDRNQISHLGKSMFDSKTIAQQYIKNYRICSPVK